MLKKTIAIFAVAMLLVIPAKAQFGDIRMNDDQFSLGIHLGQGGTGTEYADLAFGFSMSVYGFYIDCVIAPPDHTSDNHLINQLVSDDEAFSVNFGYQFPLFSWLRVAPIIGYSQVNYGYTDLGTLNQHVDDDGDITNRHDYNVVERFHEFNFGGGLFVKPVDFLEIYGVYTRRAIYGGIAFNFGSFGAF